jgi:hypothetical protein
MGCDIHLHTEVKINGQWHHYSTPDIDRTYALFAKMANVRNCHREIEPISEPKGLPDDMTFLTRFDRNNWEGDAHSDSWLNIHEIKQLYEWLETNKQMEWFKHYDQFGYCFGNLWTTLLEYPDDMAEGLEDVRFIFWFDN